MKKQNQGITLIALVITIIVLLILAGVTVTTLTGDNGLLSKAQYAKEKLSDAEIEEQIKLAYSECQTGQFTGSNITLENSMKNILEKTFGDEVNVEKQGNNVKITFKNSNKTYKYYSNGKVKLLLNPTSMYAKLDDNDILYLRATQKEGYNKYSDTGSIKPDWNSNGNANRENIKKVIIEEPIAPTNTRGMFTYCKSLEYIENINNLHTENSTNMGAMFHLCNNLIELDVSNFDTSNVTDMSNMFVACSKLTTLDVSNFDTSNVEKMNSMFDQCKKITNIDVSGFDTGKVTNMSAMFRYCIGELDLSNFNTENVTDMTAMFHASGIKELDISNFDTSKVTKMSNMFSACSSLKVLKASKSFKINEETVYTKIIGQNANNIMITVTQNVAEKFKEVDTTLTNNNFKIIE